MDKHAKRLKKLISIYINTSKEEIKEKFGKPIECSDIRTWIYSRYSFLVFKEDIIFIFKEGRVIDIMLTNYLFGVALRNVFYHENDQYRSVRLFRLFRKR